MIQHVPGMNIDYDLTIIDTPGFGDTRGVPSIKSFLKDQKGWQVSSVP